MTKIIFSTLILSLVFLGCAQKPEERQIQKKDKKLSIELEGTSYPYKSQTITSINGKVSEIKNNVGSFVNKNDVIFSIDEKVIQKQIAQLEKEIEVSEKNLYRYKNYGGGGTNPTIIHLARMNLEKVAKLYAQGYTSEEKFNEAKNEYANALYRKNESENSSRTVYYEKEQNISEKRVELFKLQDRLENTLVKAIISGYISKLDVYEGKILSEGENIGSIVDISRIKVKAGLAPGLLPFVKKNKVVTITFLTTPAVIMEVPVKKVIPVMDPEFGRIIVEFEVPNKDNLIQSGTKALVNIVLSDEDREKVNFIFNNNENNQLSIKAEN